jgi:hypothetical protein
MGLCLAFGAITGAVLGLLFWAKSDSENNFEDIKIFA